MAAVDVVRNELLDATDQTIEAAVEHADPMVLRGLLYQLTGDPELVDLELKIVFAGQGRARVLANDDDIQMIRRKAAAFLTSYRDAGAGPVDIGPAERLATSVGLVTGEEMNEDGVGLAMEELALDPWIRGLEWRETPSQDRIEAFEVTVVGAGMGGLNAALQLKRAGIPYTVIEKNSGVGGTWFENHYPGARVDTPSRGYGHMFAADYSYPYSFCDWRENQKYFDWIADAFELRDDIVFDTEVTSMTWNDGDAVWEILVEGPSGERTIRSRAVVTSVGYVNRPKIPEIEGMLDFSGPSWHTARWPADFEHAGKRIAVIGTGCTGYQVVPELARDAEHVVVFQRTPQWIFGVDGYLAPIPDEVHWLDRNLPFHANFMRARMLGGSAAWGEVTEIDPEFQDEHALSELNKGMRDIALAFLEQKIADPELRDKLTPKHPVWSARPVMVDSEYSVLDAIQRDNVTLVTDGIRRINETGIEANDGTQHDVDVIVYATGFHATEYLFPMKITGRDGVTVDDLWRDGGARAYRFSMLPGFPNFFAIYGPNTNGAIGPNSFHEMVMRYALQCMEKLIVEEARAIEPTVDAYRQFNEIVDARNARKMWSDPRAHNFYWTEHGRSAVMCPFSATEVWRFLRHPDFDELEIDRGKAREHATQDAE